MRHSAIVFLQVHPARVLEATRAATDHMMVNVIQLGVLWVIDLNPGRPQAEYAAFQHRDVTTFGRYVE